MRVGLLFRLCVLWGLGVATVKAAKGTVPSRMSRQALEADLVDGVWSNWGEWSECSQTCGLGVSHRSRKCAPPPPQAPPLSLSPPHWAGYTQRGMGGNYISPMGSYYPPRYPGQHSPYHSSSVSINHNQGLSLFRSVPSRGGGGGVGEGGGGPPVMGHNRQPTLYQQDYSAANQDRTSFHRSPYQSPSLGYGQPGRIIRRPTNPGTTRGGGGGTRRSVSTNRESLPVKRSSTIRPGQFGYGRVPFSLPLHRPNRQVRHTINGTDEVVVEETSETLREDEEEVSDGEDMGAEMEEEDIGNTEEEVTNTPAEEEPSTTTTTTGQPQRHMDQPSHSQAEIRRSRQRVSPFQPFHRSSVPSVHSNRHRFDWHSVTAPPPPISPHSRSSTSDLPLAFSPPLHRPGPVHRDREVHPDFIPQSNIYPLQHPHNSHMGIDSSHSDEGRAAPPVYRCFGPEKEYRRCFSQVCAGGVSNSRAEQCAAFNTQEFMGRLYNWEPFTEVGVDKQCELTCRPAGYRFYVRQAERVRDGTPCFNISSNDVCVEGRCLTEGCNGVLGSGSMIDKCGVCGGQETSCQKVTGSFQNATVPLGYHKILDIPPGATFINITERRASPNYLAMRSGTGASVVNGRWSVDPPGVYQAGGTTFTYTRPRAQAEGQEERGEALSAPGPTTTQLQLYIIFQNENPGINYEFYIPVEKTEKEGERERKSEREREAHITLHRGSVREPARAPLRSPLTVSIDDPPPAPPPIPAPSSASSSPSASSSVFSSPSFGRWTPDRLRPRGSAPNRNARIPPRTDLPPDTEPPFVWRRGGFTECSASCGKGFQHRVPLCISRYTDEEVPDTKCDSAARPVPEEEPCNVHPCPPFWEASAWSECSVSCGSGVQQRQLQCRQSFGNRSTMVHPQRCAGLTPPESMQTCQLSLCSHWEVGSDWSSCSVDCGVGRRTRNVRCVSDQGSIVNDQECNSRLRPQGTEDCNMGPCVTNWYFTAWSNTCSARCGPGVQKRDVVCLTRGGVREGGGAGDCVAEKPSEMKACNGGPCVAITMWYSSPWSQCNVQCGNGTQRRDNICVQKLGNDYTVVQPSQCAHLDKPVAVQECEMGECEPRWFTTEWSACSRSCGKGLQMREVRCLNPDKRHSYDCDPTTKPDQEQICNTIPCSPQVSDENCRDRRHNCMMVVQARLCVYAYYKTACCASCTQSAQRAKRH